MSRYSRAPIMIGAAASGKINRKDFGGLGVADVFIQLDVELIQRAPRTSSH